MAIYPRISIVTPCFNAEKYLEETILSVLEQNYPNLEYIIIDGGSTDKSVDIIKKYQYNLAYWISEKDNGMYDALQKGFKKTTGEIMAWINADDVYHKKSFFIVSEIFTSFQNIHWLLGASTIIDESSRWVNIEKSRKFTRYDFLMDDFKWIQQESCFWRRTLWEKAGSSMNTTLHYAGDFDLWMRFFRFEKLYVANSLIGGFRIRSTNQLSLEGMDEYLNETTSIIKNEVIDERDKKLIRQYKRFKRVMKYISRLKIFNTDKVLDKYYKTKFAEGGGYTPEISFNRMTQKFELK